MRDETDLFDALGESTFRRRFVLGSVDRAYFHSHGLDVILEHGRKFIRDRLAPAVPRNEGRQTPMRGHPVFVAQHATATCCRRCLGKWHFIAAGKALTDEEIDYVIRVLGSWLLGETEADRPG